MDTITKGYKEYANYLARNAGYGRATEVLQDANKPIGVIKATPFGYRKCTNGEYVSNAYRASFGWKNTYYQKAECVVNIGV